MPQLAFAHSFWQSYDVLEKPVKAGVRKAMAKFQQLTIAELHADKGLHLESVHQARDPRMRTIRVSDFCRGVVLAPERRTALLAWAREHDALVVEDDYDAEYRYDRDPVGALQGLDPDRVLFCGSTSKTLAPGLRLGWAVAPRGSPARSPRRRT